MAVGKLTAHKMAADVIAECRVSCESNILRLYEDAPSAKRQKSDTISASVGCAWIGKISELDQHKESCEYVEVGCLHGDACTWKGYKVAAHEHAISCDFRIEHCQHCNEECRVCSMQTHLGKCRRRPTVCVNAGCDTSYPHEDLAKHLSGCSKQTIDCPYHESLSCSFSCAREDMPAHVDDAAAHFKLMAVALQSARETALLQSEETRTLKKKLAAMDERLACGTMHKLKGFMPITQDKKAIEKNEKLLRKTMVVVSGAGTPEVNGDYRFKKLNNKAGFYTRRGEYQGREVDFCVFKCKMTCGTFQWFLSILAPGNSDSDSDDDRDFYEAEAEAKDKLPPSEWTCIKLGTEPAPSFSCLLSNIYYVNCPDAEE